jgi:SpoVK/Ycf46/Vps4 family AAA+-type ATPase
MQSIVMNTPGYVGADLNALIDEALISALDRRLIERIKSSSTASANSVNGESEKEESKQQNEFDLSTNRTY